MITYTKDKLLDRLTDTIAGHSDTEFLAEIATKVFVEPVKWNDETQLFEEH